MSDENRFLEENTARLIGGAFGPEARPDRRIKGRTWRLLAAELEGRPAPVPFPAGALVALAGVLAFLAVWFVLQSLGASDPVTMRSPLILVVLLLTMNLAWVPIATVMIVIRRRHA